MVSSAIEEAQKLNLTEEKKELKDSSKDRSEWSEVKRRNKRKIVVGQSSKNSLVRGIPRYVSLHVSRLEPGTKTEDLKAMLVEYFPEVNVSKYPELYASSKVTIKKDNLEKAWQSEIWPQGAVVSRFFHRRSQAVPPP